MVLVRLVVGILGHRALSHWLPRRGRIGWVHVSMIVSHWWVTNVLRLVIRCRRRFVK